MNFQQNKYYGEDNDETLLLDDYKKRIRCCNRLYISAEILLKILLWSARIDIDDWGGIEKIMRN